MNKPVIFLQNAWSATYAGKNWPRESWLRALAASRSGKVLRNLTDDLTLVHNTTLEVGATPNSKPPADLEHMETVISITSPASIVACGLQAIEAVRLLWDGPRIELPHPACRWVSTTLYKEGKRLLDLQVKGHMNFCAKVWQKKGQPLHVEILHRVKEAAI